MTDSAIVAFYRGVGTDHAGRRIDDIWSWDARRLEAVHDYIQWLFPLPDPSRFNPQAPLLSAADCDAFKADPDLERRALRSFDLLMEFLGLVRAGDAVVRGSNFASRAESWLQPLNHNFLRLTRILLFLRHIGLAQQSSALFTCLCDIAAREGLGILDARVIGFWRSAAIEE